MPWALSNGVFLEVVEFDKLERDDRGGFEVHLGSASVIEGFLPAEDAEAPGVAGFQAGKGKLRSWSAEVVPAVLAELQKLGGELGADAVESLITGSGPATTIAKESGHGIKRAGGEFPAQNIEIRHAGNWIGEAGLASGSQ